MTNDQTPVLLCGLWPNRCYKDCDQRDTQPDEPF